MKARVVALDIIMPFEREVQIGKIGVTLKQYKGETIPLRCSEYLVRVLNFINSEKTCPTLKEMAKQMKTSIQTVERMEGTLEKYGILSKGGRPRKLRILERVIKGKQAAELLIILTWLSDRERLEISESLSQDGLRVLQNCIKEVSGLEYRTQELIDSLKSLQLSSHLVVGDSIISVNNELWRRDKLIIMHIHLIGHEVYEIPNRFIICDAE